MKQFDVNKFRGQDEITDPHLLAQGESESLLNMRPWLHTLQSIKKEEGITIPTPVIKDKSSTYLGSNSNTGATIGGGGQAKLSFKSTVPLVAGEYITLVVTAAYDGRDIRGAIYADDAGGSIPGTLLYTSPFTVLGSNIVSSSTAIHNVCLLLRVPSDLSTYWISMEVDAGTTPGVLVSTPSGGAGYSPMAEWGSGTGWRTWNTAFPSANQPTMFIIGTSLSGIPDDIKSVKMPYEQNSSFISCTNGVIHISNVFNKYPLGTVRVPEGLGSYEYGLLIGNNPAGPGGSQYCTVDFALGGITSVQETLFVLKDGIVAATAKNSPYCIPIMYNEYTHYDKLLNKKELRDLSIEYFNGSIITSGYGPYPTTNSPYESPSYYDLNVAGAKGYTYLGSDRFPKQPEKVVVYNNSILFYDANNADHRMYYGEPGSFGNFDTQTDFLNLTTGEYILSLFRFKNDLLCFTTHATYVLSGVPGLNAVLRKIKNTSLLNADAVVNTPVGIFCALSDGFFLYNGSWQPIPDKWGLYSVRENNTSASFLREALGNNIQIIENIRKDEILLLFKNNPNIYALNYLSGEHYKITHTESIQHLFKVPGSIENNIGILTSSGFSELEKSSTQALSFDINTGWIDPEPIMERKQFKSIIIESRYKDILQEDIDFHVETDEGVVKDLTLVAVDNPINEAATRIRLAFDTAGRTIRINAVSKNTPSFSGFFELLNITVYYTEGKKN